MHYKMEHYKIYKLLSNNSAVSKFATTKWIKVNDLSGGQSSANINISDCSKIWTHSHLVCKLILNHLAKLTKLAKLPIQPFMHSQEYKI